MANWIIHLYIFPLAHLYTTVVSNILTPYFNCLPFFHTYSNNSPPWLLFSTEGTEASTVLKSSEVFLVI